MGIVPADSCRAMHQCGLPSKECTHVVHFRGAGFGAGLRLQAVLPLQCPASRRGVAQKLQTTWATGRGGAPDCPRSTPHIHF